MILKMFFSYVQELKLFQISLFPLKFFALFSEPIHFSFFVGNDSQWIKNI